MKKLDKKVALVTSSTKGIGLASAEILAENGAIVYIAARSEKLANEVIDSIKSKGGVAKFVYFNALKEETSTNMIEEVYKNEGRIDILVNNYGGTDVKVDKDLVGGDTDEYFKIVKRNLQTVYLSCKAAIPHMIENGGGSIINISSIGSVTPDLSRIAYCTSKAAINSSGIFLRAAFVAISPGNIAKSVLFFASDDSSYITGQLQEVAGGFAIATPQYAEFIDKL